MDASACRLLRVGRCTRMVLQISAPISAVFLACMTPCALGVRDQLRTTFRYAPEHVPYHGSLGRGRIGPTVRGEGCLTLSAHAMAL